MYTSLTQNKLVIKIIWDYTETIYEWLEIIRI
jgi:hypothetical protein